MIQSTKAFDLLKAKPIAEQIRLAGEQPVKNVVQKAILKASDAMDISIPPARILLLTEELIDLYTTDSIEDIIAALRNGRRGQYQAKPYGKINLELITSWMSEHLDQKAREREKVLHNEKVERAKADKEERLIDRIYVKNELINSLLIEGKLQDADKEIKIYKEMKKELIVKTAELHKKMENINAKKEDREYNAFKVGRLKNEKQVQLAQYRSIASSAPLEQLKATVLTHQDVDVRQICKEEIERRNED